MEYHRPRSAPQATPAQITQLSPSTAHNTATTTAAGSATCTAPRATWRTQRCREVLSCSTHALWIGLSLPPNVYQIHSGVFGRVMSVVPRVVALERPIRITRPVAAVVEADEGSVGGVRDSIRRQTVRLGDNLHVGRSLALGR